MRRKKLACIFARIPGWMGYWACADGRIWSEKQGNDWVFVSPDRRIKGHWLKPHRRQKDGRLEVALHNGKKTVAFRVHRLILLAFVGPCPKGMEGCHNDGDHRNNELTNLRYDYPENNRFDQRIHEATGKKCRRVNPNRLSKRDVEHIIHFRKLGINNRILSQVYQISHQHMSRVGRNGHKGNDNNVLQ